MQVATSDLWGCSTSKACKFTWLLSVYLEILVLEGFQEILLFIIF